MDDCAEHVEIRMDDENRFVKDYLTDGFCSSIVRKLSKAFPLK